MADKIPSNSALTIGGQIELVGYIVTEEVRGGRDIDFEDIQDADGAFHTRIVFERRMSKRTLPLLVTTGNPETDFPEGAMCTIAGMTDFFVDSATISKTKSATRVDVQLTQLTNLS